MKTIVAGTHTYYYMQIAFCFVSFHNQARIESLSFTHSLSRFASIESTKSVPVFAFAI